MRAPIRIAGLAELGVSYILTHDSIGVGEDRPAHPEETAGAYVAAHSRTDGPTALILSRQNVATLSSVPVEERRQGVLKGGYVAKKETADLEMILMGSGSELQWAMSAAEELGAGVRVVSMPSMEIFDRQSAEYKAEVLPPSCTKRMSIEAGITPMWWKYVGLEGKVC